MGLSEVVEGAFRREEGAFDLCASAGDETARVPLCLRPFFAMPLLCVALSAARRVFRLSGSGVSSAGMLFVLIDFLLPSTMTDVGPSTATFFQGGDAARDVDRCLVRSSSLRFLLRRSAPPPSLAFFVSSSIVSDVPFAYKSKLPLTSARSV